MAKAMTITLTKLTMRLMIKAWQMLLLVLLVFEIFRIEQCEHLLGRQGLGT
jgi:hypothetical protein